MGLMARALRVPLAIAVVLLALAGLPLAASKGCFVGTTEVTMADGSRKHLADIRAGDRVASFDEATGKAAASEVMAVPAFQRREEELVELTLPSAVVLATDDHPLWSRSRGRLVSLHPNGTKSEYDLEAELLEAGEELEDERQQPVRVLSVAHMAVPRGGAQDAAAPSSREARSLRGVGAADGAVRVLTLCLQPHHWYYVHGVRVHNKGCFLQDTEVTLESGSRKQLRDIVVGDRVASWDEASQKPAVSTVKAVPTFKRQENELVQLSLPSVELFATEDHPFWSRSRRGLVSAHPNGTWREYSLEAQRLAEGEELEGEHGEAVGLLAIRRAAESQQLRQLRGVAAAAGEPGARTVEVSTLCLEPHHWFYARGVRVHNKGGAGCFAPWTPILMADGAHKSIESVRVNDTVASWDEAIGSLAPARVVGVDVFDGRDMLEVTFSVPGDAVVRQLRAAADVTGSTEVAEAKAKSLIVTPDHPIYSARARGAVSMRPNTTLALYAMGVDQMYEQELLHHHSGSNVPAQVHAWAGNVSSVMTLRLDRHHWFFAEGVRVHNKGGRGGRSSSGRSSSGRSSSGATRGPSRVTHTASSIGRMHFATFIIIRGGSRRRYGSYQDEEGACNMRDNSTVGSACETNVAHNCSAGGGTNSPCCHDCLACKAESCISNISGCESFLSGAFSECEEEEQEEEKEEEDALLWLFFLFVGVIGGLAFLCMFFPKLRERFSELCPERCPYYFRMQNNEADRQSKLHDQITKDQGNLPPHLVFSGTYTENGETKTTSYDLIFHCGFITGTSQDDDGTAVVHGLVNAPQCIIALKEERKGVIIKISGLLTANGFGGYSIEAEYVSDWQNTHGRLSLQSAAVGAAVGKGMPPAMGQGVMAQVVGSAVTPGSLVI